MKFWAVIFVLCAAGSALAGRARILFPLPGDSITSGDTVTIRYEIDSTLHQYVFGTIISLSVDQGIAWHRLFPVGRSKGTIALDDSIAFRPRIVFPDTLVSAVDGSRIPLVGEEAHLRLTDYGDMTDSLIYIMEGPFTIVETASSVISPERESPTPLGDTEEEETNGGCGNGVTVALLVPLFLRGARIVPGRAKRDGRE